MSNFRVGQKVCCVETWVNDGAGYGDEIGPISGEIYTIRDVGPLHPAFPADTMVLLSEIVNPVRPYAISPNGIEPSFGEWRFRPVVDRKPSIEVFTKMLNDPRARIPA